MLRGSSDDIDNQLLYFHNLSVGLTVLVCIIRFILQKDLRLSGIREIFVEVVSILFEVRDMIDRVIYPWLSLRWMFWICFG